MTFNRCNLKTRTVTTLRLRGSILVLVLVAIVIMSLTTSTFLLLMRNEHLASRYSGNRLQANMLTRSGVDYLRVLLSLSLDELQQQGGLLNNPELLQDVLVVDDEVPGFRGRFSVLAPDMVQGYYQGLRFGLQNESAKLNLNSLLISDQSSTTVEQTFSPQDRLLLIPGMNEDVANAILDWMDENDSARSYGAEAADYQSLSLPYQPRNGPFAHLDELLMVRGVTSELLFGVDGNRNLQIDANEQPVGALAQLDNTNGELDLGWSAYLTVHSSEINNTPAGEPKIDVNSDSLQTLHGELLETLGAAEANFIIAFRQFGPVESNNNSGGNQSGDSSSNNDSQPGGDGGEPTSADSIQLDFEKEAEKEIGSLLDLVGVQVSVTGEEGKSPQLIESPWRDDGGSYRLEFADLLDVATSDPSERTAGRININLASRPVLLTVPGMTEVLADQILVQRNPTVDRLGGEQRHATWLIADGLVTLEEFKPMFPFLTTGGDVYSCQVVGFFDDGTARARAQVVLDRSGDSTRLLAWENLSKLGPGFSRTVVSSVIESE